MDPKRAGRIADGIGVVKWLVVIGLLSVVGLTVSSWWTGETALDLNATAALTAAAGFMWIVGSWCEATLRLKVAQMSEGIPPRPTESQI